MLNWMASILAVMEDPADNLQPAKDKFADRIGRDRGDDHGAGAIGATPLYTPPELAAFNRLPQSASKDARRPMG